MLGSKRRNGAYGTNRSVRAASNRRLDVCRLQVSSKRNRALDFRGVRSRRLNWKKELTVFSPTHSHRTEEEFAAGHVEGSINIPVVFFSDMGMTPNAKFVEQLNAAVPDKEVKLIMVRARCIFLFCNFSPPVWIPATHSRSFTDSHHLFPSPLRAAKLDNEA